MSPVASRVRWWWVVLFLFALSVRLFRVDWDQHHFYHPDERAVGFAVERLSFSPLQLNPHFFAYGSLPLYVIKCATSLVGAIPKWRGYDMSIFVGRAISALWGAATVLLIGILGARLYGRRVGLLAGFLMAAAVLHVQNSHFATSDVPLTFLVLLALYFLVRVVESGSLRHFLAAGLVTGLAIATKFSALPILLPVGIAVLYRWVVEGRRPRVLLRGAAALLLVPVGFALGQPYAILDFQAFRSDILEQSRMVRHAGIVPYTNQYIGVPKYWYDIKEMVLWGMGPLLGLAAVFGTIVCGLKTLRTRRMAEVVLLSWVLPFFVITGSFDVKFPRYLLPIYPLLILWGAWGLVSWASRSRAGKLILGLVVAITLLWLTAFTRIYTRPHTVVTASEWFYRQVPAGTKVASQHWDEGFPFPLPGNRNPDRFRTEDLPYYEPDTPEKINQICKELASAEYAVFQTKRIYGAVTRAPEKFPLTNRYFYRLFAGDLGFRLTDDFASRPTIFGIGIPDELADESFSVYDHPKVLVFRNTAHLSAAEIEGRVLQGAPSLPLTRRDLLLASAARFSKAAASRREEPARVTATMPVRSGAVSPVLATTRAPSAGVRSPTAAATKPVSAARSIRERPVHSLSAAAIWLLALYLIAIATFPLAFALFPRLADRGAGLARILGLALVTYVYSLAVGAGLLPNSALGAWVVFAALAALGAAALSRKRRDIREFWRSSSRRVLAGELAFLIGYVFFLAFRAFNPEIYWGEKPMDFSILNILVRTPALPPSDPWFSGAPLGYYTFGQEMLAFLTLLCSLSTRYTFNLAFGLLGGTILQGAFSLGREWGGRVRAGVASAGLLAFVGNLAGAREWIVVRRLKHIPLDWDYFWATSRVIKDTINEYPFWSLIFADLHAHVLAIPVFLLVIGLALELVRAHADPDSRARERLAGAAVFGFAAAAQALTNAWDVPFLLGVLSLVGLVAALAPRRRGLRSFARAVTTLVVAGAAAFLLARPLWVRGGGVPAHGWNGPSEPGAAGVDVLTAFGLLFFLAVAWWVTAVRGKLRERGVGLLSRYGITLFVAAFLTVAAFARIDLFLVAGILLFLFAAVGVVDKADERLACALLAAGFFLVLFPQRVFIYDRMNTFFKLYLEAWLVLGLSTAVLVFGARAGNISRWSVPARAVFAVLLAAALFTTVTAGYGALQPARRTYLAGPHTPTLDGLRYLDYQQPGEARAVAWMRRSIRGTPVIVEAQGPSYQEFGRISMLTGLPTVLGWEYHVQQRGNRPDEIAARRGAVSEIYSNSEAAAVERLLRLYHVGYVYVGWVERKTYPTTGLAKFDTSPSLFAVVYENPEAKVYRVVGGDTQDVLSVRETVLPPTPVRQPAPPAPVENAEPEEKPTIRKKPDPDRPAWAGMREPRDGAVDGGGRVWLADFGNSRLRIFDASGGSLGGWGGRGNGQHGFNQLCGVATVGEDLYVADTWNGRIERFGQDGTWKAAVAELYGPRGVAVAPDGSVWVTDTGNHRVISYDPDLKNPHVHGKKGTEPGEFDEPVGIAVGPSGLVSVADTGNRRIQVFDLKGYFHGQWPIASWARGSEAHIEADSDDSLYAADPAQNAVLHLDAKTGIVRERFLADSQGNKFVKPTGLALDRKNRILYVVNTGNNSVSTLKLPKRETPR